MRLLSGSGPWTTQPAEEIGLASMTVSDGPVGVRGGTDTELEPSAAFPSGSAMAATWDEDLLQRIGNALAGEAVRKGVDVVLGPTINLHRSPLGGRHFECMSEDPLLTGRLATAYVRGVQERGIGACPKHYVANDAETDRFTVDNRVDERTLRELYLAPFEAVVADADPWMVMAAYNSVNGTAMTENDLLQEPLKGEWGFDGVVVSDWGALYDGEPAARAALDLTMPGPDEKWAEPLVEAVRAGRVPESAIDAKLRRLLRLAARTGALEGAAAGRGQARRRAASRTPPPLAREAAASAAVLLTQRRLLPLDRERLRRVAVLGPGARDARPLGGGSASVPPAYVVTPVAGITAALDGHAEVVTAVGAVLSEALRVAAARRALRPRRPGGRRRCGGSTRTGRPSSSSTPARRRSSASWPTPPRARPQLEIHTGFTPDEDGDWRIGVVGRGDAALGPRRRDRCWRPPTRAGRSTSTRCSPPRRSTTPSSRCAPASASTSASGTAGRPRASSSRSAWWSGRRCGRPTRSWRTPSSSPATSDVAVVVVGTSDAVESEGFDRTSLTLPGRQDELVRAVAAVNPRTVVVVNAGSPVELPWRDEVAAVLVVWFPGMEFGNALADVLTGAVEPGGRLPTTWPAAMADAPVPRRHAHRRATRVHRGPRHRPPRLPGAPHRAGVLVRARPRLHDLGPPGARGPGAGDRRRVRGHASGCATPAPAPGKHVVQVYASRPGSAVARPQRWLAGFAVVTAEPGQVVDVPVRIHARALRHWDTAAGGWAVEPGDLTLAVGRSAGEVCASATVALVVTDRSTRPAGRAPRRGSRHPLGGTAAVVAAARRRPRAVGLPDHHRQRLGQRLGGQRPEPARALRRPAAGLLAAGRVAGAGAHRAGGEPGLGAVLVRDRPALGRGLAGGLGRARA